MAIDTGLAHLGSLPGILLLGKMALDDVCASRGVGRAAVQTVSEDIGWLTTTYQGQSSVDGRDGRDLRGHHVGMQ